MTAISLPEWGPLMDSGATTYTVGKVPSSLAVYLDRAEAEAAAEALDDRYLEWTGHHGRPAVTTGWEAEMAEMEAG